MTRQPNCRNDYATTALTRLFKFRSKRVGQFWLNSHVYLLNLFRTASAQHLEAGNSFLLWFHLIFYKPMPIAREFTNNVILVLSLSQLTGYEVGKNTI